MPVRLAVLLRNGSKRGLPGNGSHPISSGLTRCRLLWTGLVGEKFKERASSLLMFIPLEGDVAGCCGNGGSLPRC